jgi:hypothetical protein
MKLSMTDEQYKAFLILYGSHYSHTSFEGMFIEIAEEKVCSNENNDKS